MLLVYIFHIVSGSLCGKFSCDPYNPTTYTNCISQSGLYFQLSVCSDLYFSYCPMDYTDTRCALPPSVSDIGTSYPGEPCTLDRNCLNSICTNGYCVGSSLNGPCVDNSQCNPGLYCESGYCKTLVGNLGECTKDTMCLNGYGCNFNTCFAYFYLSPGLQVQNCENNQNFLCKSGACAFNATQQAYVCVSAMASNGTLPIPCSDNSPCSIADSAANYYTQCTCGYNIMAQAYCALAPGDPLYLQYINYSSQWAQSGNISNCNTDRRFNSACIQNYANNDFYITYMYYLAAVKYYPQVQQNDECIQNIYTPVYWKALSAYNSIQPVPPVPDSAYILAFGFIFILF